MPDFGSPVAQEVNVSPQRSIQTISGLLGLKSQQLGIQGQTAEVQQQQQTTRQRAGLASFMQGFDPTKHVGADGTIDLDSVLTDPHLRSAAGDQFPAVVGQMIGIKQGQLQAKQQLINLNDSTRTQFQGLLGGLRTDPDVIADNQAGREKVQRTIGEFAGTGPDAARIAQIYGTVVNHVPQGKLAQTISNFQLQAMDASTQAGRQAPALTSTGAQLQNINPQAAGGNLGATPPIGLRVPPGMQTFSDQGGNVWAYNPQDPGHATLIGHGGNVSQGAGGPAPQTAPGAPHGAATPTATPGTVPTSPPVMAPGAAQNVQQSALNDEQTYAQVRTAANKAPVTKNILGAISTLASESTTGIGSREIANAEAVIGQYLPGFKATTDAATNRQLLGKYVEQLALQTAESSGISTDAARATVASAIPDPEHMTPDAIQKASRFIMAQTQVAQARGAVAEHFRETHGGSSQGLRAVDSMFMQGLDPRAFDYIGMNPAERRTYLQQQFGGNAQAQQTFADQLARIEHLGGFIPWEKGGASTPQTGGASGSF